MNKLPLFVLTVLCLHACRPDELADVIAPGASCGSEGARIEATIDGNAWCANASVIGVSDGSSVTITGINALGGTLVMQIDSLGLGPQPITEAGNAMLFTNLSMPYSPLNSDPGQLIIATIDTAGHRVTGNFNVMLHTDGGGAKQVSGAFDVHYLQQ